MNTLKVGNIVEVIKNRNLRGTYTFVYLPTGESYYLKNGKKLSQEEIDKLYPIDLKPPVNRKGDNVDKTRGWLSDKKSY